MKRWFILCMVIALCLSAFMGCNQGTPAPGTSDAGTTKPSGDGAGTPATTDQGGTPGTQVRESILRMTHDSTPVIDPQVNAGLASSVSYLNMYDTLVFPQGEGVIPWLAESWTANEKGDEFTFKLKQGVKFHDGSELKASDVVFTVNRFKALGEGFAYLYSSLITETIAQDDYTVVFKLSKPFGPFPDSLVRLYIMNEDLVMANLKDGAYGEFGDYGRDYLINHDAGSGPYQCVELITQDYFLGEKFDDWHAGWESRPNAPKQLKLIYGTEPATVRTMMETQGLEITDPWQTIENINEMAKIEGLKVAKYSSRSIQNVYFNTQLAPTDDVNVRKALACLVDYDTLIESIFVGSTLCNGPVSKYTAGHVDATRYPFDVEKAKEYLAQSKYADTIGDYELEFMMAAEGTYLEKMLLAVQAAAKQAGITIKIQKAPWVTFQERVSAQETTPNIMTVNSNPQYNEAGATLDSGFHSKTQGTYENCAWLGNVLDAEIEDALATVDRAARFEKYAAIQHKIADELCSSVWVGDLVFLCAYQDTYVDWYVARDFEATGEISAYLMGYECFAADISVFTDR